AGDRKRRRARIFCACAHLPVYLAGNDGQIRHSQSLHIVPSRQEDRMGGGSDGEVERGAAVAGGVKRGTGAWRRLRRLGCRGSHPFAKDAKGWGTEVGSYVRRRS